MSELSKDKQEKLIHLLTDPESRRWSLNQIRKAVAVSWSTVDRYALDHDQWPDERPTKGLAKGLRSKSKISMATAADVVRFLRTCAGKEAKRLLKVIREEDERVFVVVAE